MTNALLLATQILVGVTGYGDSRKFAEGVTNADGSSTVRFGHTPPLFIFVQ